jgi:hypothetical protein
MQSSIISHHPPIKNTNGAQQQHSHNKMVPPLNADSPTLPRILASTLVNGGENGHGKTTVAGGIPYWYSKYKQRKNMLFLMFGVAIYMIYTIWNMNITYSNIDSIVFTSAVHSHNSNRDESAYPKDSTRMGWNQVRHILDNLPLDGHLLVWGIIGNDSSFWNAVTTGTVVFLEDDRVDTHVTTTTLTAYTVKYTTQNTVDQFEHWKSNPQTWDDALRLENLPDIVWNTKWDVILIDAPLGNQPADARRLQSMYMSKVLVQHSFQLLGRGPATSTTDVVTTIPTGDAGVVHVFVDDYQNSVAHDEFSQVVFDRVPIRVVPRHDDSTPTTAVPPNEQAHYVFYADDHTMSVPKIAVTTTSDAVPVIDEKKNRQVKDMTTKITSTYRRHHDNGSIAVNQIPTRKRDENTKITESYDGIPYWQKLSKVKQQAFTTLEHSTAADAFNVSLVDAPIQHLRKHDQYKPIMAIITSARSSPDAHPNPTASFLYKHLIQSILHTVSEIERTHWTIHLYVAVDHTDEWWLQHWKELDIPVWLQFTMTVFPDRGHHIPFNEVALTAYNEGADYFCRVNDDTEFLTNEWITTGVSALQNYDPPNIGVVGPKCSEGNTVIMTHDMVHRTHMEIFRGYYYPPSFGNWYLDDWITNVYTSTNLGPNFSRSLVLGDWVVKHWLSTTRYIPDESDAQWLPIEYDRGRRLILDYIRTNYPNHAADTWITQSVLRPELLSDVLTEEILRVLPPGGNLLLWGFSNDAQFWHRVTSGRVVALQDQGMQNDIQIKSYPYLEKYEVIYAHDRKHYQSLIQDNQDLYRTDRTDLWCQFELRKFPDEIQETFWDVVLVDSCSQFEGCHRFDQPGIFSMLYSTKTLIANQLLKGTDTDRVTHIFVDDYEHSIEHDFVDHVMKREPNNIVEVLHPSSPNNSPAKKIAHFTFNVSDSMALENTISCS